MKPRNYATAINARVHRLHKLRLALLASRSTKRAIQLDLETITNELDNLILELKGEVR